MINWHTYSSTYTAFRNLMAHEDAADDFFADCNEGRL